ncbi:MAG: 4-hydroxythreonine-4-phosphate dehydrogenase PdxA [Thainema sp.]
MSTVIAPVTTQSNTKTRSQLALTLGDPAGIGPEIVLKALADPTIQQDCEITVIGSAQLLQQQYEHLRSIGGLDLADPATLKILDVPLSDAETAGLELGTGNAASGAASFHYLETAVDRTLAGEFAGVVTAPIAKSAWKAAGHLYPGQTELLAERADVTDFGMFFVARSPHSGWSLKTLLATTHIPLREVPDALTPELMSQKLDLLIRTLRQDFGLAEPQIAIAGLNPHSGEQGQLGREEVDWLTPWLQEQQQRHPQVRLTGLVPPDTLWVRAGQAWHGTLPPTQTMPDAYLALYHDQGLIPVKLLAFDQAVNTTIGLPFIRTSPDHGTAFDIAGRGIADATSLKAAITLAAELAQTRQQTSV